MVGMAPRKKTPRPAAPASRRREGYQLNCWIDTDLAAELQRFREGQRFPPEMKLVVELALREFLEREKAKRPASSSRP